MIAPATDGTERTPVRGFHPCEDPRLVGVPPWRGASAPAATLPPRTVAGPALRAAGGGTFAIVNAEETMMHARFRFAALAGSTLALCAACATPAEHSSEYRESKVYQTGSNIPVRDRSGTMNVKIVDPESLHQELSGASRPSPVGGAGR
ncbi:MAG TPA: hypothetical protein VGV08_03755 [Casimicrobiaceae bacterium]|nr:hypothetical protein [Casimicrobiaceae bacterium]